MVGRDPLWRGGKEGGGWKSRRMRRWGTLKAEPHTRGEEKDIVYFEMYPEVRLELISKQFWKSRCLEFPAFGRGHRSTLTSLW